MAKFNMSQVLMVSPFARRSPTPGSATGSCSGPHPAGVRFSPSKMLWLMPTTALPSLLNKVVADYASSSSTKIAG